MNHFKILLAILIQNIFSEYCYLPLNSANLCFISKVILFSGVVLTSLVQARKLLLPTSSTFDIRLDYPVFSQLESEKDSRTSLNSLNSLHHQTLASKCNFYVNKKYSCCTGLLQSFQTPKMCHLGLISLCEKKLHSLNQIIIGIIPTLIKCGLC